MWIKTRLFRLFIGRANWLGCAPWAIRFMWKPIVAEGMTGAVIPCAWDAWLSRYGFVQHQRGYEVRRKAPDTWDWRRYYALRAGLRD